MTKPLPAYSNEPNFFGYPLYYIKDTHIPLCNECATDVQRADPDTLDVDVNWECTNLYCEECSKHIASAYNDIESIDEDG